ncbi:MAG TPA: PQQ-binding-like beta-propeller repeat protein [Ktedonobacteraceae bacterium]|nr:PQQ-binding-like beta-propeller repeat protein [Ktedonobacteraceae bacterium]
MHTNLTSTAQVSPTPTAGSPITLDNDDWPTFLLGDGRSGYNGAETHITPQTASNLALYWSYHTNGGITTQPIVAKGVIYWGSWDGYEHATTLKGKQLWSAYLGVTRNENCGYPSLGVASTATVGIVTMNNMPVQVVFVAGGNGYFYALNALNGKIIWSTLLGITPLHFIWSSPLVYQGSVYEGVASLGDCPNAQGQLVQMNVSNGQVENVFNVVPDDCTGGSIWSSPTINTHTGELYITTGNAGNCNTGEAYAVSVIELHAVDLSFAGSWQVPPSQWDVDSDFGATPTLFSATIHGAELPMVGAINKNGVYYAFVQGEIGNGPVWSRALSNVVGSIASSAWDGERLYVAGGNTTINGTFCQGSVNALDPATGKVIWQRCLTDERELAPVTATPGLIVVGEGRFLLMFNAITGKTVFEYEDTHEDSLFDGAPTIADGLLVVGNMDGYLYTFAPYQVRKPGLL